MTNQKQAAGYIRVSSEGQTDNTSLPEQRNLIETYAENNGYQLTEIYADEGISGTTTKDRPGIQQAINDASAGKYEVLIVKKTDRFGRNLLEILQNHKALTNAGAKLEAVEENLDNKMFMQIRGLFAEQEVEDIKERMMAGRIAKAKQGYPTGPPPFGRTFDKETEEWGIIKDKKDAIQWVYEQYMKDRSLQQIALELEDRFGFSLTYPYLIKVLKERCGTTWEVHYEELDEPVTYKIPRLLSDRKIQAIKDRLAHNRTNNRTDVQNKYLLTGFIRCMHCHKSLYGQTQQKTGKEYRYYVHQNKKHETCDAFGSVPLEEVEAEVLGMIFTDMGDVTSFEKAIASSLPDTEFITKLDQEITNLKSMIPELQSKLNALVDAVLEGTLEKDTIREREQRLKTTLKQAEAELQEKRQKRKELPDVAEVKKQAHEIRADLLDKYQSVDHLADMSFQEKRQLLHFLFDGKAPNGKEYGIYIDKEGKGQNADIYYSLFGRLRAYRSIKDDDGSGGKGRTRLFDVKSSDPSKPDGYKTNNFSKNK